MASASKIDLRKERAALTKENALLDDQHFPRPTFFSDPALRCCEIVWLRPKSVTKGPQIYRSESENPLEIMNDYTNYIPEFEWFLIPLSHVCQFPKLIYNMLPKDENFSSDYGGMFKVKFFSFCTWQQIVIDDRLPFHTCDTTAIRPYFVTVDTGYWLPLIIKAYAKLHGSYEKLVDGNMAEAYTEFTSGISETYPLKDLPPKFHVTLKKYFDSSSLMTVKYSYEKDQDEYVSYWTVMDITCKKPISKLKTTDVVVKLRYAYPVREDAKICDIVTCSRLMKILMILNSRDNDEGAYWISYHDFVQAFQTLQVCLLELKIALSIRQPTINWVMSRCRGTWYMQNSGSHSLYDPGSIPFWTFPQFKFELRDKDSYRNDERCEFIVTLQQPAHLYNANVALIGYFIFKLVKENTPLPLTLQFFKMYRAVTQNIREGPMIQDRRMLPPGTYVIIPVAEPENHNDFNMTLAYESNFDCWGFLPKKQQADSGTARRISQTLEKAVSKYSHLKRLSQDPSATPTPSELAPKFVETDNNES